MPNWDDFRGWRGDDERAARAKARAEREAADRRREPQSGESRSFDTGPGRFAGRAAEARGQEPWRRDRYAARFDQERTGYGDYEEADDAGYRGARRDTARFGAGGEARYGYAAGGARREPGWGFERGGERARDFDRGDPGLGQGQAGYAAPARPHPDHDLDPEYLQWRDEQLRAHDRDYYDWRREQHRQYDEQYRQYRNERQRHFGEAFHQWRSQRGMVGGVPDTSIGSVGQGQGGYGDKTGIPGGYNAASAYDRPTGYLDPPGHLSADPAMSQVGGSSGDPAATGGPSGDRTPEFGREPPQVQGAADGAPQGHEPKRDAERDEAAAKAEARRRDEAQRH